MGSLSYSASHQWLPLKPTNRDPARHSRASRSSCPSLCAAEQCVCTSQRMLPSLFSKITTSWRKKHKTFLPFSATGKISSPGTCLPGRSSCWQKALKESKQLQSLLCQTRCAHKVTARVLVSSHCETHFRWSCLHSTGSLLKSPPLELGMKTYAAEPEHVFLNYSKCYWNQVLQYVMHHQEVSGVFWKVLFVFSWTASHKWP